MKKLADSTRGIAGGAAGARRIKRDIAPFPEPVHITRPLLPKLDEYVEELSEIWDSARLTNDGAKHRRLESELRRTLGVPYLSLFSNGTTALLSACRILNLSGEVITT
ncbi:MAG: DegT/DnrJ/EryC1/StrS family aminotransferase, partial [Elusimicrobiota bacterium]